MTRGSAELFFNSAALFLKKEPQSSKNTNLRLYLLAPQLAN